MSWLEDTALRDLDDSAVIEAACMRCLHVWRQIPLQLLIKVMHRDIYLDEVAQHLACPKPGCRHVGVRLIVLKNEETSGFVGGMP
jgi:hypothetical protein